MSYLLYCVITSGNHSPSTNIPGVGDQPVSVVSSGELATVISEAPELESIPVSEAGLAYHRVIAAFHKLGTVIPLRYGSYCRDIDGIINLLSQQRGLYMKLLAELNGCTEMGIRVLLPANTKYPPIVPANTSTGGSGHAFLAARRAHYSHKDSISNNQGEIVERCLAALTGIVLKHNVDKSPVDASLFSINLLVRADSVPQVREAFSKLCTNESAKLLLSGPWPPYSFVQSGNPAVSLTES